MSRFAFLLAMLAAVLLGPLVAAQERSPKGFVENMLESMLAAEGRSVAIDGVNISLTGNVSATRIEVRDGEEPWLVMEGLALEWSPLSLFSQSLQITSVKVDSIDFLRLPKTAEGGVAAPKEATELTAADIKSLKIAKFRIAAAVAGEEAVLAVDGSASIKAAPAEIRLDLTADRTDGKAGRLKAGIVLDPASRAMTVDVALNEEAGGLIAGLLSLSGEPAVDLTLAAKGTFDNWTGDFGLDLDKSGTLQGKAQIAGDVEGSRLTLEGGGEVGRLLPAALAGYFRGASELVASVAFPAAGGRAEVQRIRIDSAGFELRAAGPIDWAGTQSDLTIELRSKDESLAIALPEAAGLGAAEAKGLSADIRLTGAAANPGWSVSASAASFASDLARLATLTVNLKGTGLVPAGGPVRLEGDVKAALGQGAKALLPPAAIGPLAGRFTLDWRESGGIAIELAELGAGVLDLRAVGLLDSKAGTFDLNLEGKAQSPATGYELADRLLKGAVALAGRIAGDGKGGVIFDGLRLTSGSAEARIGGRLDATDLDLTIEAGLADLGALDSRMSGRADVAASLKGPRQAPQAVVNASGEGITLMAQPLTQPKLTATLRLDGSRPTAALEFSALLENKPVALAATLESAADGTKLLRKLEARSGTAHLAGELRLPPSGIPSGNFSFAAPDLRDIAPFLLTALSGSLEGKLGLEEKNGKGSLQVAFTGHGIAAEGLSAGTLTGTFGIADVFGQPRPDGRAAMTKARLGGLAFTAIEAAAKATGDKTYAVTLKASGEDLSGEGTAAVAPGADGTAVDVSRLAGRLRGIAFAAAKPFAVRLRGEAASVTGAAFAIGKGRVNLDGALSPVLDARLALSALPLSAFEKLASLPGLAGTLSGRLELKGRPAAPSGRFDLTGSGIDFAQWNDLGLAPLGLEAAGSLANGKVTLKGGGRSGPDLSATIDGEIGIAAPVRLDVRLRGRAGSQVFADRLAASGMRLTGTAEFDLRVSGAAATPKLDGAVSLSNATFGDAAGRFILRNGSGRATVAGNAVRIVSLQGTTGKNGRAALSGTLTLDQGPSVDLQARIRNGIYADGTLVNTRYDADLALRGSFAATPLLSGRIDLKKTKVTLSEIPPSALRPLEVDHVRAPAVVERQVAELRARGGGGAVGIGLDVLLNAADPISVSGRGLSVLLGGRLKVTGLLGAPQASGAFRLQRGSLKLLARRLEFESGRLDFDRDLDPRINFVAVSRRTDATITLTIAGRASTPEISVTSSPRMPQEEALARLMFDRSMLQLSPFQLAQIAGSIATLSGGGSDGGLLSRLQSALGIDWIEATETETGETAIGIGKRVNDRLSIGVEQTTKTNTSRVIIDLGLTGHLKVRGALGTDGSSRAGVAFEKDY